MGTVGEKIHFQSEKTFLRWFMGRENLQNLDANRGHEPGRFTFVRIAAQRDRTVL